MRKHHTKFPAFLFFFTDSIILVRLLRVFTHEQRPAAPARRFCVKSMAHIQHAKQLGTWIAHRIEIVIEFQMRRALRSSSMSNFPSSTMYSRAHSKLVGQGTIQH